MNSPIHDMNEIDSKFVGPSHISLLDKTTLICADESNSTVELISIGKVSFISFLQYNFFLF
jgi:hypothetical protein